MEYLKISYYVFFFFSLSLSLSLSWAENTKLLSLSLLLARSLACGSYRSYSMTHAFDLVK